MSERIQKLLATTGVASRRAIETMIAEGRITVNGRPAETGQRIDHDDHVRVDGHLVTLTRKQESTRVLLYRKRTGELVTREDPEGRKTVFRKLPELEGSRWIAVGRLDINTSGLLLLTNDGELARRLMHPSFEMRREYAVRVLGTVDEGVTARLRAGVELEDGFAKFETIRRGDNSLPFDDGDDGDEKRGSANSWWIVTVRQGRNRVVRRLFESQNLQVSRLIRISYGPIALGGGIRSGSYREAEPEELKALLDAVKMQPPRGAGASKKPPAKSTAGHSKSAAKSSPESATGKSRRRRADAAEPEPASHRPTTGGPQRHVAPRRRATSEAASPDRDRARRERFPHAAHDEAVPRAKPAAEKKAAGKPPAGRAAKKPSKPSAGKPKNSKPRRPK